MSPAPETPYAGDPIAQTIEMIAAIHARAESQVDRHQRAIERITGTLGRPACLYVVLTIVVFWIVDNLAARHLGQPVWDPPPFYWLQGLVGLSALLTTIVVLITQNRLGKMAERRSQLDLQMNLLVEQKVTKLIDLMEELRRDLPSVRDREDLEAQAMTEAADPTALLTALEVTLEHGAAIGKMTIGAQTTEAGPES
jgi:uncharacterized membrane protein